MEKRMKRSQRVMLTTLTAAGVVAVQACNSSDWSDDPSVEASPYASVAECQASGRVPADQCQTAYSQAVANHDQAAPRFESQPLCEEQFGNGQCQQRMIGGGNVWMPLLAGFMVGRMLDSNRRPYYGYGGLYRSRRDNAWYTGGVNGGRLHQTGGGWRAGSSAFGRPTATPAVRSRSSVSRRGGFGARSRGGGG